MTLIGVISDTHGVLVPAAYNAVADCDVIIHAGDIGGVRILDELETLHVPLYAVYGNNDYPQDYGTKAPFRQLLRIDDVSILVSHYPRDVNVRGMSAQRVLQPDEAIPKICIHGHTHCPKLESGKDASPADFIVCPGSVSRPRSGYPKSFARIEVDAGAIKRIEIVSLEGSPILTWGA